MLGFLLTVAAGAACGLLFCKLHIPGGMLVGSILGAAVLNVGFGVAEMPYVAKLAAQMTAGAFIGCGVNKQDILHMRHILKPAAIILGMFLLVNILTGFLVWRLSPLDLTTAMFCAVPGGISDIPLIAADMGAVPVKVAALQFARLVVGVGIFPSMICRACRKEPAAACPGPIQGKKKAPEKGKVRELLLTLSVAALAGSLGVYLGVPAGPLVFALFGVIALKLTVDRAYLPMWTKRTAQVLSGCYIGCTVEAGDLLEMYHLIAPILIVSAAFTLNCFLTGGLLKRFCGMSRKEGMLAATPAGASDMALISMDMGIQSPDLVVLQVIRLVVVVSVFPQVIGLILRFMEPS